MPAAIAATVRFLIQTAVTTGIWIGVDKVILPYLKDAVQDKMIADGMSEEEAKDHVANDIIDIIGTFGAIGISIRSKFPTKAAEYLGFTTKGWNKRTFTKIFAPAGATVTATAPRVGTIPIIAVGATAAQNVAKAQVSTPGFLNFTKGAGGILNTTFLGILAVTGLIDFGNWQTGAYSDTFQKIFSFVTGGLLQPNEDYRKSLTVSAEVFDKVFNAYKLQGATHINDPFKGQTVEYTRDNFLDVVDKVGAKLLKDTGGASAKQVLFVTQNMIVFQGVTGGGQIGLPKNSQAVLSTTGGTVSTIPKVYTGIVSQGVIGRGLEFVPRQDDLIESLQELQVAAANNLTPFLQSLLGKIVYEVKIVSSVMTKEGFKQTGTVQQVRNGSNKDGSPKYKTVVNKFAQLNLYILTDKGVRSKITTITLGPTDSTKFFVGPNELRSIEAAIPDLVFTKDINDITGIETINAVTVTTPASAGGMSAPAPLTSPVVTSASPVSTQAPTTQVVGLNALTLSDWFGARGQVVPLMAARAASYESYGLGQANYYIGTAEQNTKLLAALKKEALEIEIARLQAKQKKEDKTDDDQKKSEPSSGSSSGGKSVPTVKGVKVNTKDKITVYGSGGAKIGNKLFTKSEYAEFKEARAKFLKS